MARKPIPAWMAVSRFSSLTKANEMRSTPRSTEKGVETRRSKRVKVTLPKVPWKEKE